MKLNFIIDKTLPQKIYLQLYEAFKKYNRKWRYTS